MPGNPALGKDPIIAYLAETIRHALRDRGMTVQQLCAQSGTSYTRISKFLRYTPDKHNAIGVVPICRIFATLGLPIPSQPPADWTPEPVAPPQTRQYHSPYPYLNTRRYR